MKERTKIQLFIGLLFIGGLTYWYEQNPGPSEPGVLSADSRFTPLDVKEPALQLDRLEALQRDEYAGSKRNIFLAGPAPALSGPAVAVQKPFVGPQPPPPPAPPPPVQVPVEFYGVESSNGRKVALFKNGDDPLIVPEGASFLNRFRLVRIGNTSADVEEISSGRHATLPLVLPEAGGGNSTGAPSNMGPGGPVGNSSSDRD